MRQALSTKSIARWLALSPEELLANCKQSRYQGSGPGGQKRNRVYSGNRLTHSESGLTSEAVDSRESNRNTLEALRKLRLEIGLCVRPRVDEEGDGEGEENLREIKSFSFPPFRAQVSASHFDFPIFVFRAIYFLILNRGQVGDTAKNLGCTASALARFLKIEKSVWARAKEVREEFGMHGLK